MTDDEDEWVCGESYDHNLELFDERDGVSSYVCRECGAEIISDESDDVPA